MVCIIGLDRGFYVISTHENPLLTRHRYYNGSTTIEIKPFDGVAAQEEEADVSTWCPNLKSKTIDTKYDTILGLTARSKYDAGSNSLNALLTLWDVGYNFSSLNKSEQILDMPWDWALLSSP